MRLLLTILLSLATMTLNAQTSAVPLQYLVRPPGIASDKAPLIILLHGVGSNEKDLFSFADRLPAKYLVVSARGPVVLGPTSFAWYAVDFSTGTPVINAAQAEESRKAILAFIGQLKKEQSFDEQQVYLVGFSQGAIMSYSVALTEPGRIKGIASMSGRLLEETKPRIAADEKLKSLKVFISHGVSDPVLKVGYAREGAAYLKAHGIQPVYKEYPEAHTISAAMLQDLIAWLQ